MPTLHTHVNLRSRTREGQEVGVAPPLALAMRGPCIQVSINVTTSIAEQLASRGESIPGPISGLALIDTGASTTCVDSDAARRLGAPPIDVVRIASASHASTEQNVYPIRIEIVGFPFSIDALRCIGVPLSDQGLLLLVGRDVLQHCTLFYNGVAGQITLSI